MPPAHPIEGWVFTSIGDVPENNPPGAANMPLRSELMTALQKAIAEWGLTQSAPAQRRDVTQPRSNDLNIQIWIGRTAA